VAAHVPPSRLRAPPGAARLVVQANRVVVSGEFTKYLGYMQARYYDPQLGRFLSVDPVMDQKAATKSPRTWNRHTYVINNPD
jgi:RHS repeat-associated protein